MDDVRYLHHADRRRRDARRRVAIIAIRQDMRREAATSAWPSLARSARAAGESIKDFAVTVEVERMWESACAAPA